MTVTPAAEAAYILPTLERFRNKLLDLTTRNNLLNLSLKSQKAARLLRFVDCNLQAVLNGLVSGCQYSLSALPEPPKDKQDSVDEEVVEAALAKARTEDPLYQQILADGQGNVATKTALAQAEDRLRAAVLEGLGNPAKSTQSSKNLIAWAEKNGVDPSYSLSVSNSDKANPDSLRVLLLDPRMERVTESIRKQAQSSIEETGNNILYLAFGCLEWVEKKKSFFAPLILLPVELTKSANRGGAKTFYLSASDDAPVGNVTLKERLRRDFGIEFPLPDLSGESVDLQGYLKLVAESVSGLEGWQVQPYLNLALFNFSGLGLYEDLIPEVVQGSPLVRQLLAAEISDEELPIDSELIAEDVHVDQPEIAALVPVLIAQADASQFAAVADVMAGRSMVIEGPPGTGKSQTITNIIANALYAGKRILFVAEKKVALDVVYTRLSEAGLKPYCLRIESDKANKKQVYDELAERIDMAAPMAPRRGGTNEVFNELRQELNNFAVLLNQPHGEEAQSQHELLWKELQLRCELTAGGVDPIPHHVEIKNACANSKQRIEQNSQFVDQLAKLLDGLDRQSLQAVFEPLSVLPADALGRDALLDQAVQWSQALRALMEGLGQVYAIDGLAVVGLRKQAMACVEHSAHLPDPLSAEAELLLPVLCAPSIAGMAQTLLDALQADAETDAAVSSRFVRRPETLPATETIQALVVALGQWRLGSLAIPAKQPEREQLRQRLRLAVQLTDRLELLLKASGSGLAMAGLSPAGLQTLLPLVEHLSAQPDWVLRQRSEAIWQCDPVLARALVQEHNALTHLRQQLQLDRAKSEAPPADGLTEAIEQIQLCCERGLSDLLAKPNADEQLGQLLAQAEELFEAVDSSTQNLLPSVFAGVVTPGQALSLPELLRSVLALDVDAISHRSSSLWDADKQAIQKSLEGESDLKNRELALQQAGLKVLLGYSATELREAADLLEKKPLLTTLLNQLSGSNGRAIKLARDVGVKDPAQRVGALRDVAKVIELRQDYGPGWQRQILSVELSSERLLPVVEQLQQLKELLHTSPHGSFWSGWLRHAPASELQSALNTFDQGLTVNIEALIGHRVFPTTAVNQSIIELRETLSKSRQDQTLLAEVEPFARWARAAGLSDGKAMGEWLQKVLPYDQRLEQFPHQDLEALLKGGLEIEQVEAVLDAAERARTLLAASGYSAQATALMAADQVVLSQALLTLQHQLAPLVKELMAEADLLPADAKKRSVEILAQGVKDAAESYQALLQQWQDASLRPENELPDLLQLPLDLALAHRRKEELVQALTSFQKKAGPEVAGAAPDLLEQAMTWIAALRRTGLPTAMEDRCLKEGASQFIVEQRTVGKQIAQALESERKAATGFISCAQPQAAVLSAGATNEIEDLDALQLMSWLNQISDQRDNYPTWVQRHQLLEQLPADGLRALAEQLLASELAGDHWSRLYRWNLVRSQLRQMAQAIPELQRLRSNEQVARRERFQRMEEELRALDRAEVVAAIHHDPERLPAGINTGLRGGFTEMGLIHNECRKQKRHRPLRHLFHSAGESLRGLKPCWMMSPGTLASLVSREVIDQFDLVIVDEASQMPPERAFGLISRARQCVVVGDPKQLPPTSFFQRTSTVEEEEGESEVDTEVLDEESILDLCTKTFNPVRRLKWHYRSRHGSLIAFSNKHFYNSELVVFPSCDRDFAIHRHLVGDARYTKGVNLPEVKLVCDVVLEQLENHPDRSLGVVAMNEAQASEIGEQLEMLSLQHTELRRRLELKDTSEELFVKSLEKVQGDERDTIVISCTYGASEPGGPVAMRFGPINQQGGHRRLNVLFTRAKRSIELVTSIEAHQIQPLATSSQGVHAFRNYLKFVESQSLETGRASGREPDSPFEVVVAEAIQRHGYEVDCQVGVANYFIDLAIRHPDRPDTYLLGVECDGATYHSARAARDRDKYRQGVLEGLGWQIYRIWSTDWFENSEVEIQKLITYLRGVLG